ncbi:hypothetical protein [Gaoshiqia sediminis]|uniref:Uncharacterized protein n=1 Tax=Gaoshiqia sediminis TaxID=2986998 RepID=A0AA41Y8Z5_9BACT|nr:hypothetical protein [Gaoshiqia sediminis]MCW0484095.1 hypothetical protein [Gaoshiqia sediminis]
MEKLITPIPGIIDELKTMDEFLTITMSEDAEEAVARGNDLAAYIARSGKLLADAKYHLNKKMKDDVFAALERIARQNGATPTAINAIVKSICKEEQFLVDWSERTNRSATHQLEWCRTVISKAKEEMRLAGFRGNNP